MSLRIAVGVVCFGFTASLALPQVPVGAEFQVNAFTVGDQFRAAIAPDASGNFVVVWSSYQDASATGIFARRYDASGAPLGAEFQVNSYTPSRQTYPAVASDPGGNFVVAWRSYAQDGSGEGVFAQRHDSSGVRLGSEFRVNTYTTFDQQRPSVASDAAGNFVVVWDSWRQDGAYTGIFAQRYDASGARRGVEFRVSTTTAGGQCCPSVVADALGNMVVAWTHDPLDGIGDADIRAQRYDASGAAQGGEFRVNAVAAGWQTRAVVAMDAAGNFVVAFETTLTTDGIDIAARRFDSSGTPLGSDFPISTFTTWHQLAPSVAMDATGSFVVAWEDGVREQNGYGVFARRYDVAGAPIGSDAHINTYVGGWQRDTAVAAVAPGRFVVAWTSGPGFFGPEQDGSEDGVFARRFGDAIVPAALAVDTVPPGRNGVLEPGETVDVRPSWSNLTPAARALDGAALSFDGPAAPGVSYQLVDDSAAYGTVPGGETATCADCYEVAVTWGNTRPTTHWDASLLEELIPIGERWPWVVHVGESFEDVPKTSPYYRFVETLLHKAVTAGCGAASYCPQSSTLREQMAAFVLLAKEGPGYAPPACVPPNMFTDVPETSIYCDVIEELARRGATGCGGGNFCPGNAVSREHMAVFVLKVLDPIFNPPACMTPVFTDVPATSPFCPWIEELAHRGIVTGCGGGNYCPLAPVTREQMAVFLTGTFGLSLYGP
jgi:hypothetical protein